MSIISRIRSIGSMVRARWSAFDTIRVSILGLDIVMIAVNAAFIISVLVAADKPWLILNLFAIGLVVWSMTFMLTSRSRYREGLRRGYDNGWSDALIEFRRIAARSRDE